VDLPATYIENFQAMEMKITLLINENERLMHMNEGLMKENVS
jgi:hypothetical protein